MESAALNAKKHGLLSELPVIDGFETQDGWLAHREAFCDDLKPQGAVEEVLVERIALTFWRMARLSRAEVASAMRHAEQEVEKVALVWSKADQRFLPLEEARDRLDSLDQACDWLSGYSRHAPEAILPAPAAAVLRRYLHEFEEAFFTGLEGDDLDAALELELDDEEPLPAADGSAIALRAAFERAARFTQRPLESFLSQVAARATAEAYDLSRKLRDAERKVEQVRANCQLPPEKELQLFTRYDAHLGRELARLFRTLRDLKALSPAPTPTATSTDPEASPVTSTLSALPFTEPELSRLPPAPSPAFLSTPAAETSTLPTPPSPTDPSSASLSTVPDPTNLPAGACLSHRTLVYGSPNQKEDGS